MDTIKALIQKGVRVGPNGHKKDPRLTPIGQALLGRKLPTVLVLAEYGAPVNFKICDATQSYTPLSLAAEIGSSGDIKILIQHGADPDVAAETKDTLLSISPQCSAGSKQSKRCLRVGRPWVLRGPKARPLYIWPAQR